MFRFYLSCLLVFVAHRMFMYAVVVFGFEELGSGALAGAFHLGAYGPTVVLSIVAGILLDRLSRDRVLMGTIAALAVSIALVGALTAVAREGGATTVGLMVGAVFVYGSFFVPLRPAYYAVLSRLAARDEDLSRDTVSVTLVSSASYPLAPVIVGLLRAELDWPALFGLMALMCLAALGLSVVRLEDDAEVDGDHPRAAAELRSNIAAIAEFLRDQPVVWQLLALFSLVCLMIFGPFQVLLPDLAADAFELHETAQGLYMSALGVGIVVGTIASYRLRSRARPGRVLMVASAVGVIASFPVALVSPAVSAAALLIASSAMGAVIALSAVVVQEATPEHLRGRLMALYTLLFTGLTAIGGFLGGVAADLLPMTALLVGCSAVTAIGVGVCMVAATDLRQFRTDAES